jgi:hypothetical protein
MTAPEKALMPASNPPTRKSLDGGADFKSSNTRRFQRPVINAAEVQFIPR